jgi:hypothetical protein
LNVVLVQGWFVQYTSPVFRPPKLANTNNTQLRRYYDIDIISRSHAAAREAFIALDREANKVGLKINETKTKYYDGGWKRQND